MHHWNAAYVDALSAAVQAYNTAGIAVVLDMHETQWSAAWNESNSDVTAGNCQGTGFPIWMYPDANSISIDQGICDFYNNVPEPGVTQKPQDGLVAAEQYLAGYFAPATEATHGQVIAFDMLNEPKPTSGTTCKGHAGTDMLAIYEELGAAIRAVDPPVSLIYEDYAFESYEAAGFMMTSPLNMSNVIISSHAYPATWNEPVPAGCPSVSAYQALSFYTAHLQQAQSFDQPMWIGEFDGFATQNSCADANWTSDITANMNFDTANDVSWSFWDYVNLTQNMKVLPYLQAGMSMPSAPSAPTVAVATPVANAAVSGNVTVTGTVSDANTVNKVQVSLGSGTAVTATGTNSWSAGLATAGFQNGPQTIEVSATDSAGNVGTASETVTVDNPSTPTVSIATPVANAAVSGNVTVTGTVSDANTVNEVQVSLGSGTAVTATGTNSWSAQVSYGGSRERHRGRRGERDGLRRKCRHGF